MDIICVDMRERRRCLKRRIFMHKCTYYIHANANAYMSQSAIF